MSRDDLCRLEDAVFGLREGLDALTDEAGNTLPQMAQVIGCSPARLDVCVADIRWLLEALERVQQRAGASDA